MLDPTPMKSPAKVQAGEAILRASYPTEEFTPWDQTLKKNRPDDALDILAERGYETLLTYEQHQTPSSSKPLEVIQEESKRESTPEGAKRLSLLRRPQPVQFTLNTGMCRSELELMQFVAHINGFQETQNGAMGNLIWYGLALTPKDIELLLKRKNMPYFNRYPGLEQLARKKTFCSIVNRMRKTFPKTIKFCPRSF